MNRRDFLQLGAVVAAGALVPCPAARPPVFEFGSVELPWRWVVQPAEAGILHDGWYAVVHPDAERDIREMVAREKWRFAHRAWRGDGKSPMTCQQILARYSPSDSAMPVPMEIGQYGGMRFITSEALP